jgi:hypothetical protein
MPVDRSILLVMDGWEAAARAGKSPSVGGRAMQRKRPKVLQACAACRQPMWGYPEKLTCSPKCQMRRLRALWKAQRSESPAP